MRVTMDDVAKEAGVSRGLVSLALRGEYGVSQATRDRIVSVARELNYQPNALASGLARRTNTTIGLFLLDLHNEFFADVFDGVRDAVGRGGTELVLSIGSTEGALDKPALDALVRAQVRLVIAVGLLLSDDDLAEYQKALHLVSVARRVDGADNVVSRNELGARLAVEHLVQLGHTQIMHLAAPVSDGYAGRRRGYRRAMNAAGLEPWVVSANYSRPEAARVMSEVVDAGALPTAVFAHNDQTALGVLDTLHARGVRVPADVSVIGYDNTSASSPPDIGLTTVDIHAVALGRRAGEVAMARIADPASPLATESISPTLVIRTTTAPPRTL